MNLLTPTLAGALPTVAAAVVGLVAAGFLLVFASGSGAPSRRMQRRIARIRHGLGVPRSGRDAKTPASVRRRQARTMLGRPGLDLVRLLPRSAAMRRRLDQAGLGLNIADYALLCALAGLCAGLVLAFVVRAPWPIAAAAGVAAATGLPHGLLEWRIRGRKRRFLSQFPDAIDLIVRGVRSGLPVAEALHAAGQELPNLVGSLFREVTGTVKLGKTLDESLALAGRTLDVQELKFFMISLTIQQETGGNLGEILYNLGVLMRRREQMKLKIKAMSSEARASAMIIGSLPFIMFGVIYLIDPAYVMKLFIDPRGWMLLAAGLSSLGMGLGTMGKMVRFEI
ncbi:MAG: type II secretion system F family protein [Geminicoccaceae bacterium]